ncbi:MAG: hypothetical protein IH958_06295 [Chloroflexi bacterium]|nr:hypothetical protein [Chloroflexota bacterium]
MILNLRRPVARRAVTYVTFKTTFRGGLSGDNWNMNWVRIWSHVPAPKWLVAKRGFFRFTGDRKAVSMRGDYFRYRP